ncbi:MAG: hypothetical protein WA081_05855 [Desulfosalsimonadaceae bacterium]
MRIFIKSQFSWFFILLILMPACQSVAPGRQNYDELITKLDGLTKKTQVALEEGYFDKGQKEGLEYIKNLNPVAYNWFVEKGYVIKVAGVDGHAVVLICKDGKPLFEDTDCMPNGSPDKDRTISPNPGLCEITMTAEDVNAICKY